MTGSRAAALAAALSLVAAAASAEVLDTVTERGRLLVGVKADYRPFGFRDASGALVGLEPDLGADIARRLGVKLELVPVTSANRLELLSSGKIDVLLATMTDKVQRRNVVQVIEPSYYADYANVLLPKGAGIAAWEEFRGKTLCATAGLWYNREVAQTYGAAILASEGTDGPLAALKEGRCTGYLFDQAFFQGKLLDEEWSRGHAMPLKGILGTPWVAAVQAGNPALKALVENAAKDWTKSGLIAALERKWLPQAPAGTGSK